MIKPYLSVIIPAYNEARTIENTIHEFMEYFSNCNYEYEIVVVNDGSTDQTKKIVENMIKTSNNSNKLKILSNNQNMGKGYSVRRGMLFTKGQFRLFTDADNSTSINQIEKLLPYCNEGFDIVIGSRTAPGSRIDKSQPLHKVVGGKLGNLLIRLTLLPGIYDTQCGFKCFKGGVAEKIFSLQKINGYIFDAEILMIAYLHKIGVKEVPVVWEDDPDSRVKLKHYLTTIYDIVRIKKNIREGSYL
jgi:dolichyl-phosphate beta-glucosyltransferase